MQNANFTLNSGEKLAFVVFLVIFPRMDCECTLKHCILSTNPVFK